MIFIFIALVVALAAAVAAMYRWQRGVADSSGDRALASPVQRGLFDHSANGPDRAKVSAANQAFQNRAALKKRASEGDVESLRDAHESADVGLYCEVLDALVEQAATRQETLQALVSQIATSNNLRANIRMAELVIEAWKNEPTRRATAEALHIAALSDDATTYQAAVEAAIEYSRSGRLPQLSAEDLIALVESQYWALSSEARSSGAGFALKQRLAGVRRELTTATTTR
jgi:hypothetical protein